MARAEDRDAKLAAALRANLRRRKAAASAPARTGSPGTPGPSAENEDPEPSD